MKITEKLKNESGYNFVMSKLSPLTPFGRKMILEPIFYTKEQKDLLEIEFSNIHIALHELKNKNKIYYTLLHTLTRFKDIHDCFNRHTDIPLDEVELFEVKHFLLVLEEFREIYNNINPFAKIEILDMSNLLDVLDPTKMKIATFCIDSSYSKKLLHIREEKKHIEKLISEKPHEKVKLLEDRRKIVLQEDKEEFSIRCQLTKQLMQQKEDFLLNITALGKIDLILEKARLALRYNCIKPSILVEKQVCGENMLHLQVLENLEKQNRTFMPISLNVEKGSTVITGANMGGKSVSLKTITLQLLLLHTGFFVFAENFKSSIFENISLILADLESIERGLSSFATEMTAVNDVLTKTNSSSFFLALDEFARGTNPKEGASLASALVKYLGELDCVSLVTTHYDGVSKFANSHYQVAGLRDNFEDITGEEPLEMLSKMMDYTLIKVSPDADCPKDALKVCKLLGLNNKFFEILKNNS